MGTPWYPQLSTIYVLDFNKNHPVYIWYPHLWKPPFSYGLPMVFPWFTYGSSNIIPVHSYGQRHTRSYIEPGDASGVAFTVHPRNDGTNFRTWVIYSGDMIYMHLYIYERPALSAPTNLVKNAMFWAFSDMCVQVCKQYVLLPFPATK